MKHHALKVGLGDSRDTTSTGEGISQVFGKFLQGYCAGNSIFWVRNVGTFGVNGKEDKGDAHRVTDNDHGGKSKAIRRWNMANVRGRRHTRGSDYTFE